MSLATRPTTGPGRYGQASISAEPGAPGARVETRSGLDFARRKMHLTAEYALRRGGVLRGGPDTAALLRDGYVVIPNFVDDATLESMIAALPDRESCVASPEGTMTQTFYDAADLAGLSPFFRSPRISRVMKEALGRQGRCLRTAVQYRDHIGETGAFEQFFHMDTWLPRFKAFLYLTDVDEGGGPLRYIPKSNHGLWRLRTEFDIYRLYPSLESYVSNPEAAFVGCYWPHDALRVARRLGSSPLSFAGPAGTLILFDARGLHATTPLTKPRTILYSYWTKRNQHM